MSGGLSIATKRFCVVVHVINCFFDLFNPSVVGGSVRNTVPVKGGMSFLSCPRESGVLYGVVNSVLCFLNDQVVGPGIVYRTATVVFPVARFSRGPIMDRLFSVKKVTTGASFKW